MINKTSKYFNELEVIPFQSSRAWWEGLCVCGLWQSISIRYKVYNDFVSPWINLSNQRNYKFLDIYFSDIFGRTCQLYSATFNRTLYGTFLSGVIVVKSSCQLLSFSREKTALGSFYSFINACSPLIFCGIWFIFCFSYICIFTCQLQYFFAQTKLSKQ